MRTSNPQSPADAELKPEGHDFEPVSSGGPKGNEVVVGPGGYPILAGGQDHAESDE